MCFDYSSWQDCPSGEMCIQVESQGMTCEEVQLVLDGSWTAEVDWSFELGLEAFIDGWEIAGWSFEETWSADGEISDTLTICVPPACFDAFWGWEAGNVDVESLLIWVLIEGGDSAVLFDWFDPFNDAGFGLLPDCNNAVSAVALEQEKIHSWPNPAHTEIRWQLPMDWVSGELQVFDARGRQVHMERVFQGAGRLDVSSWPVGLYSARWRGRERSYVPFKILIVR